MAFDTRLPFVPFKSQLGNLSPAAVSCVPRSSLIGRIIQKFYLFFGGFVWFSDFRLGIQGPNYLYFVIFRIFNCMNFFLKSLVQAKILVPFFCRGLNYSGSQEKCTGRFEMFGAHQENLFCSRTAPQKGAPIDFVGARY